MQYEGQIQAFEALLTNSQPHAKIHRDGQQNVRRHFISNLFSGKSRRKKKIISKNLSSIIRYHLNK